MGLGWPLGMDASPYQVSLESVHPQSGCSPREVTFVGDVGGIARGG